MGASQLPPPPPPSLPLLRLVRPRLQRPPQLRRLPRLPPVRLWRLLHPLLPLRPGPWQPRPPGTQPTQACSWWGQQRRGPAAPRPVPVQAPPVSATAGRVCQSTACCSLVAAQAAQGAQHRASGHARQLARPTLDLSFEKSPMAGCSGARAAVHTAQPAWHSHCVEWQGWSTLQRARCEVGVSSTAARRRRWRGRWSRRACTVPNGTHGLLEYRAGRCIARSGGRAGGRRTPHVRAHVASRGRAIGASPRSRATDRTAGRSGAPAPPRRVQQVPAAVQDAGDRCAG